MTGDAKKSAHFDDNAVIFTVAILGFALAMTGALEKIIEALEPHSATINEITENYPTAALIDQAGWLPHPTFPVELLEIHKDDMTALNMAVTQHYSESWDEVRKAFEEHLGQRRIDEKAKELFRQAFTAHGLGLYTLVPRAVFPELERIWRNKFDKSPLSNATSHPDLMQALGEKLSLSDASPRGIYGFNLLAKFHEHVFKRVTEEYLPIAEKDPVPNRHAALHGYFVYDTAQSSLNALIMADYVLYLFDALDPPKPDGIDS